jgi:nuclear pore complex protein Nup93
VPANYPAPTDDESVDGIYLWAQAYYLFRSGYQDEALDLISDHAQSLSKDDWSFPGSFKSFLNSSERRLPKSQKDQLYNDFNGHIRSNPNVDQFKYALYKIVGRFELARKSLKVAGTTEDWMWLQLSLVRESRDTDSPQEQYDLNELGKLITKYGNDKFDSNGTRPFAWFNLLLYTAQFEKVGLTFDSKANDRRSHTCIPSLNYGPMRYISPLQWPTMESCECLLALTTRISVSRSSPMPREHR